MSVEIVNETGLNFGDEELGAVARELSAWVERSGYGRAGPYSDGRSGSNPPSLFDRQQYKKVDHPYDELRMARVAVRDDDIVGGAADVTEGLMFQGLKFESVSRQASTIMNHLAKVWDLDGFVRAAYRDLFTYSQVVVATTWGFVDVPPMGKSSQGNRLRKTMSVYAPDKLMILDPLKVIPMRPDITGRERLLWYASESEMRVWTDSSPVMDPIMSELVVGPAQLTMSEIADLPVGVDHERLLVLNRDRVWRHTATKPTYQAWPDVRLRSVFGLLDLKQQLMSADRSALAGNARYIILMRKGSKEQPGMPQEVANLRDNYATIAKLPVIISDHRLSLEIIAPKLDFTLVSERYDTVDRRLMARTIGALTASSSGQRNESTLTVARMVGNLLLSRRHMIKRALERNVIDRIVTYNPSLFDQAESPRMVYYPARIELDSDSQIVQAIMGARASNEISRESMLEFLGFSQDVEAQRRAWEEESGMDEIFKTVTPFDSPENNDQKSGNSTNRVTNRGTNTGGRPLGGGQPNQNAAQPGKPKS